MRGHRLSTAVQPPSVVARQQTVFAHEVPVMERLRIMLLNGLIAYAHMIAIAILV